MFKLERLRLSTFEQSQIPVTISRKKYLWYLRPPWLVQTETKRRKRILTIERLRIPNYATERLEIPSRVNQHVRGVGLSLISRTKRKKKSMGISPSVDAKRNETKRNGRERSYLVDSSLKGEEKRRNKGLKGVSETRVAARNTRTRKWFTPGEYIRRFCILSCIPWPAAGPEGFVWPCLVPWIKPSRHFSASIYYQHHNVTAIYLNNSALEKIHWLLNFQ